MTEFPPVLANMDKNLSWTSSLGDAYMNQQKDVMNAVQVMRQRAQQAAISTLFGAALQPVLAARTGLDTPTSR